MIINQANSGNDFEDPEMDGNVTYHNKTLDWNIREHSFDAAENWQHLLLRYISPGEAQSRCVARPGTLIGLHQILE